MSLPPTPPSTAHGPPDRQGFAELVTAAGRPNAFAQIRLGGKRRTAREGLRPARALAASSSSKGYLKRGEARTSSPRALFCTIDVPLLSAPET